MATSDLPRDDIAKYLKQLEDRIAQVERRSPLAGSGMSVSAPGEVDVAGLLSVTGNLSVTGTLTIGAGLIPTEALASPVAGQVARASSSLFTLTTSYATLASATPVPVPAGFSTCQVVVFAQMYVVNPNTTGGSNGAGGDALYVKALISSSGTTATPTAVAGSSGYATTYAQDGFVLSGLAAGSSVTVSVQGKSAYAPIAPSACYVQVAASLTWTR